MIELFSQKMLDPHINNLLLLKKTFALGKKGDISGYIY
jgi:hypothetical protein